MTKFTVVYRSTEFSKTDTDEQLSPSSGLFLASPIFSEIFSDIVGVASPAVCPSVALWV